MYYVCIENEKIISILNYQPNVPDSVRIEEITDSDFDKIQNQTHYFDIITNSVISVGDEELERQRINKENIEPREFLNSTDWMVLRHIRQKALGIATSLSDQEYLSLEQQRNDAAAKIK